MSENEGKEPKELESDKLLAQINAAKAGTPPAKATETKSEEKTQEPQPTPPEKAPKPTVELQAAPGTFVPGQAVSTETPDDKKTGKPEVDIREWAKRKGFKENDQESVLRAYREMERKLSQMNAKPESQGNVQQNVPRGTNEPGYQPAPVWQPQPTWQPPSWQPPSFPAPQQPSYMDRRAIIEQEAARFNMTPEDLERLLPLVNEVTELKLNRTQALLQQKYDAQLADLTRSNKRNAEFNELLSDPMFADEEVAFEINKIFESNPQRLKLEPTPWHNAFNEALANIGRKSKLKQTQVEDNGSQLPTEPPKSGGRGNTPGIPQTNAPGTVVDKFKRLSEKEMEEQLVSLGAIKPLSGASFE